MTPLVAPFPYFGGKSRAASTVWQLLGESKNYVEPFAGSLAVLLGSPHVHAVETVNDMCGFVSNFWRSVRTAPDDVAKWADWPVIENDLEARHYWLVNQDDTLRKSLENPDFFDAKIAGWWVWGACAWIGSGWCSGKGPHRLDGNAGQGINRQLPHLGNAGRGDFICRWMLDLAARLRDARVACGDWRRVLTPVVTTRHGSTSVFLDPPYEVGAMEYNHQQNGVAGDVWQWAVEHGADPKLRIVVAAYEDGREVPTGWTAHRWKARSGYAKDKAQAKREILYASPHCLTVGGQVEIQ